MFIKQNKILVVDDIDSHLEKLSKQFHDNGVGCKACKYDAFYASPLKGVKIAFFDVNINPSGGGSDAQIYSSLATAIQQYISKENGPYALIFWTSNVDLIEGFKAYIQRRHKTCPKPFLISSIDKDVFLNNSNQQLQLKIQQILANETIELLFDFDDRLSEAASTTINKLYEIIPSDDRWGNNENLIENFEKIFSRIATSVLGFEHAKKQPDKAIYEALLPVFNSEVLKNAPNRWAQFLVTLRDAATMGDIKSPDSFKESKLNAIFHIENGNMKNDVRGIVLELSKASQVTSKVINMPYLDWFKKTLRPKNNLDEAELNRIAKRSKLIAIEISSACDYSQNKNRLNKYLLGIMIYKDDVKITKADDKLDTKSHPESTLKVSTIHINNSDFEIWVNLNYVFGASTSDKKLSKPLFILKKEIMDMVGNRYANHVSRIGITSF
jgi:hypothetical protein